MRPLVDRLACALAPALLAVSVSACSRGEGLAGDALDDAGGDDTAAIDEPYPTPLLLEPSSDAVRLDADRLAPILLSALGTVAGRTQITIDGRTIVVADQSSPFGGLVGGLGRVDLRGAMVESRHILRLITPGEGSLLTSRAVDLVVTAGAPGRVSFTTTSTRLTPTVMGGGGALRGDTGGDTSVPPAWWTWVARDVDASLGLASTRLSFSRQGALDLTLELTDVTRDADGRPWVRVGPGASGDSAVIVWLTGPEARRAWRRVVAFQDGAETVFSPPALLFDLDDPSLDVLSPSSFEVAALRGVAVLDGRALVQLDARLDAEAARPGDRMLLAFSPVPSDAADDGAPLLGADVVEGEAVSFGGPVDAELLGPSIDVDGDARGVAGFAARIAGDRARPVEWQGGVATLRVHDDDAREARPAIAANWRSATLVLGSLASRTWLARTEDDELAIAAYDARAPTPIVQALELDVPLRATPAAVVLRGRIVALLPLGDASDAAALTIAGADRDLTAITGLRCTWAALGPVSVDGAHTRWLCGDGLAVREGLATWSAEE